MLNTTTTTTTTTTTRAYKSSAHNYLSIQVQILTHAGLYVELLCVAVVLASDGSRVMFACRCECDDPRRSEVDEQQSEIITRRRSPDAVRWRRPARK